MERRSFLLGAGALGAAGMSGAAYWGSQRMEKSVRYPGRSAGHLVRDLRVLPQASHSVEANVMILGSGIAGLTAAWKLHKEGVRDVVMVAGPELFGNAAAGRFGDVRYPTGAHYLPLPSMESIHIREMLSALGVILRDPFALRPTYDERYLLHAPGERVLYRGRWEDGYEPLERLSSTDRAERTRFLALVERLTTQRGSDGRRVFVVPVELSSQDAQWTALDRESFSTWLDREGYRSESLRWYLNYCCRDDYGQHATEISAWAGLHYFCARGGLASNAERGAVLTWPEGLAALAEGLFDAAGLSQRLVQGSALQVVEHATGVEALCAQPAGDRLDTFMVRARRAILAAPLFVAQHIVPDIAQRGFEAARDLPSYAPWLVSNFLMNAFPEEQNGAALAWDNVVYQEPGLGYVVSTHQQIRQSRPDQTVFSAYHALSDLDPGAARAWLNRASSDELLALATQDLSRAYGWRLAPCVEKVEITVRGHAMAAPRPGFLSNAGARALRAENRALLFAHSDLSGLSSFEEAAWWGYRAAQKIIG